MKALLRFSEGKPQAVLPEENLEGAFSQLRSHLCEYPRDLPWAQFYQTTPKAFPLFNKLQRILALRAHKIVCSGVCDVPGTAAAISHWSEPAVSGLLIGQNRQSQAKLYLRR